MKEGLLISLVAVLYSFSTEELVTLGAITESRGESYFLGSVKRWGLKYHLASQFRRMPSVSPIDDSVSPYVLHVCIVMPTYRI